jgi:hypothetical protein
MQFNCVFRFDRKYFVAKETAKVKYPWQLIPIWTTEKDVSENEELYKSLQLIDSYPSNIIIALRLNNPERKAQVTHKDLKKELQQFCLNSKNILFLRHIKEVNFFEIKPTYTYPKLICTISRELNDKKINLGPTVSALDRNQPSLQQLLERCNILQQSDSKFLKIEFDNLSHAKDFTNELLNFGIGNLYMPNKPKEIEPISVDTNSNNNNNTKNRFIIQLTTNEWDVMQQNRQPLLGHSS